jgi:hypothetical protein
VSESSFSFSPRRLPVFLRIFFVILALATCGQSLCAQTPEDVVRALARRVEELRELPQAVAVEWSNTSSLPEAQSIILREAFLKEFSGRHVVLAKAASGVPASANAVVRLSVRETPTAFLLLAQVPAATGVLVRMVELPRTSFLPVMTRGNGLRLTRQLLWQQEEAVLDAQEFALGGPGGTSGDTSTGVPTAVPVIFLLRPDAVVVYRQDDERLSEVQELPFTGYRYVSRALRGAMGKEQDGSIAIVLPGLRCKLRAPTTMGERWNLSCAAEAVTNMADANEDNAKIDQARAGMQKLAGASGADFANDVQSVALSAACQPGSWRLMSAATDWTQPDKLLLVSAAMKREETVASVDFAGPVQHLAATDDGKSALAVVFDLASGSYDVYRVSMLCGR